MRKKIVKKIARLIEALRRWHKTCAKARKREALERNMPLGFSRKQSGIFFRGSSKYIIRCIAGGENHTLAKMLDCRND
jgi:hypothetical protein